MPPMKATPTRARGLSTPMNIFTSCTSTTTVALAVAMSCAASRTFLGSMRSPSLPDRRCEPTQEADRDRVDAAGADAERSEREGGERDDHEDQVDGDGHGDLLGLDRVQLVDACLDRGDLGIVE